MLDRKTGTDQIVIPLPLLDLGILDTVHFVRHREHGLSEKLQLLDVNADLAGVRDKEVTLDADKIAVVDQLPHSPRVWKV